MIRNDQPTIFGDAPIVGLSSVSDGNMKLGLGNDTVVLANRNQFFQQVGVSSEQVITCRVAYDGDDFTRYREVTDVGYNQIADAVATS